MKKYINITFVALALLSFSTASALDAQQISNSNSTIELIKEKKENKKKKSKTTKKECTKKTDGKGCCAGKKAS